MLYYRAVPDEKGLSRRRAARAETLGLLVIALAVIIAALLRWGGFLRWSLR